MRHGGFRFDGGARFLRPARDCQWRERGAAHLGRVSGGPYRRDAVKRLRRSFAPLRSLRDDFTASTAVAARRVLSCVRPERARHSRPENSRSGDFGFKTDRASPIFPYGNFSQTAERWTAAPRRRISSGGRGSGMIRLIVAILAVAAASRGRCLAHDLRRPRLFASVAPGSSPPHRTSTLRNCQGSDVSMSSGKKPGRSVSGVQSV